MSAELKKVRNGTRITVLDHNHPVAELVPVKSETLYAREAQSKYDYRALEPLVTKDPVDILKEERSDRW